MRFPGVSLWAVAKALAAWAACKRPCDTQDRHFAFPPQSARGAGDECFGETSPWHLLTASAQPDLLLACMDHIGRVVFSKEQTRDAACLLYERPGASGFQGVSQGQAGCYDVPDQRSAEPQGTLGDCGCVLPGQQERALQGSGCSAGVSTDCGLGKLQQLLLDAGFGPASRWAQEGLCSFQDLLQTHVWITPAARGPTADPRQHSDHLQSAEVVWNDSLFQSLQQLSLHRTSEGQAPCRCVDRGSS